MKKTSRGAVEWCRTRLDVPHAGSRCKKESSCRNRIAGNDSSPSQFLFESRNLVAYCELISEQRYFVATVYCRDTVTVPCRQFDSTHGQLLLFLACSAPILCSTSHSETTRREDTLERFSLLFLPLQRGCDYSTARGKLCHRV